MDESLEAYAYCKVLGEWPRYFQLAEVEHKVACEVERLKKEMSLDTSEQTSQLLDSGDYDTAATPTCSTEGSSTHALLHSTCSHPVPSGDALLADNKSKQNKKKCKLVELDNEPNSREARGQGRKRKAEGEKGARKRRRPAPEQNHFSASNTSSSFTPVPPPRPVIPKYRLRYTPVLTQEQRERYVADYMTAYEEYNFLYSRIGGTLQHFSFKKEQRRCMAPGSVQFQEANARVWCEYLDVLQHHPAHAVDCIRYFHLQSKLAHIKRLVKEFDRSCGQLFY